MLFLGVKDDKARIYDPPAPMGLEPFDELAKRWDGVGLVVSSQPIDLGIFFAAARWRMAVPAAIGVAIILLLYVSGLGRSPGVQNPSATRILRRSAIEAAVMGGSAILVGMLFHFVHPEGLLAHPEITSSMESRHLTKFLPTVDAEELITLLEDPDLTIVDARRGADYERGHIESAINIPIDSSRSERLDILMDLPKSRRIVIYCQSLACDYDQQIATFLAAEGYKRLELFPGGWQEWSSWHEGRSE